VRFHHDLNAHPSVRSSTLRVAWDACCEWLHWYGTAIALTSDLKLCGVSLLLALFCIVAHTRSLLLGILGAAEIALSFPLAIFVYRTVFGIP
jgi:hypothetical protein